MIKKMVTLVLLFTSMAQAQSGSEDVTIVKRPVDGVYEDSSEYHRMNKDFQVSVMLLGLGPASSNNQGVNFGVYLNRNALVQMSVASSTDGTVCSGSLRCHDSSRFLGVHFKKYVSNSFYYTLGLDHRSVSYEESENYGSTTWDYSFAFKGTATHFSAVIGNQWQWENFTLGCDWIGFSTPIFSDISSESITNAGYSRPLMDDKKSRYVTGSGLMALRFYLGASF